MKLTLLQNQSSTSWLALKRLRFTTEAAFKAEVGPLKRLGDNENSHIIQLLTTFQYREEYNLVFEWADGGNLYDFWQAFPQPEYPPRNHGLGKWFATQLTGLASALSLIHKCDIDPQAPNVSAFNSQDGRKKYGAHGDLKPENILWFKAGPNSKESHNLGTHKLSDFGLTSFHSLESRKRFLPTGISATYRAPECDLDRHISQKYDMWSLGCVLLEHLTWYLLGSEAVNEFGHKRSQESQSAFKEDNFFSIQDVHSLQGGGATIKRSVHDVSMNYTRRETLGLTIMQQFNKLRSLSNCSDFISDILDFVQDKLLRMYPDRRCEVSEFLRFTQQTGQKCMDDEVYCTQRITPIKTRTDTNLSTIYARFSLHSTTFASANRSRSSINKPTISSTPSGPELRIKLPVTPVEEVEITQMEQREQDTINSDRITKEQPTLIIEIKDGRSEEGPSRSTPQNEPVEANKHQFLNVPSGQQVNPTGSHGKSTIEDSRKASGEEISEASVDGNSLKTGTVVEKEKQQKASEVGSDSGCLGGFMEMMKDKIRYPWARRSNPNAHERHV